MEELLLPCEAMPLTEDLSGTYILTWPFAEPEPVAADWVLLSVPFCGVGCVETRKAGREGKLRIFLAWRRRRSFKSRPFEDRQVRFSYTRTADEVDMNKSKKCYVVSCKRYKYNVNA